MTLSIRPATDADVPRIAEISMAAFDPATDAVSQHLLPAARRQDGTLGNDFRDWSIMRKTARLKAPRSVMLVAARDGEIVGYALWFRPLRAGEDQEPPKKPPKKPPLVAGLDPEAVAALREVMMKEERDSFGDLGARDVWTLDSLGVDPKQQRRGIGRMLLDWGVQKAKEEQRDCYLVSTPSGLPLYESAGFETQREVLLFGVPHMSMMKRHVGRKSDGETRTTALQMGSP